jgi:hypothetical protein
MTRLKIIITFFILCLSIVLVGGMVFLQGRETHCVSTIAPIQPGGTTSEISSTICFDEYVEMIEFVTNGEVKLHSSISREDANQALDEYLASQSSTMIVP